MQKVLCIIFILTLSGSCLAQNKSNISKIKDRLELKLNSRNDQSVVIPVNESGLLLYYEVISTPRKYYIDKYDTALNKLYHESIEAGVDETMIDYYMVGDKLIVLYANMGEKSIYFSDFGRAAKF
ncbi:MAG: hypothetical protein SGJ10_09490 [Bacteroidota bacterium]|nr:hypothetical protein [Bacteroidota bacterium]